MSSDLVEAVERLYAAFERPRPRQIDGCPCCTSPSDLCALISVPLRELDGPPARRYAFKALSTVGSNDDLRYFWPRLVELSLPRWTEIEREVLFSKPRRADWRQTWTGEEQAATEHFARVIVSDLALEGAALCRPVSWEAVGDLGDHADRWVCSFGQCFEHVTDYLGPLVRTRPATTLLALSEHQRPQLDDGRLWNAFWTGAATKPRSVIGWFQSAEVSVALSETWLEVGPDLAAG